MPHATCHMPLGCAQRLKTSRSMVAPKPNQQQQQMIATAVDYDDDGDDALLSAQVSRLAGLVEADADAAAAAVVVAVAALPAKISYFHKKFACWARRLLRSTNR